MSGGKGTETAKKRLVLRCFLGGRGGGDYEKVRRVCGYVGVCVLYFSLQSTTHASGGWGGGVSFLLRYECVIAPHVLRRGEGMWWVSQQGGRWVDMIGEVGNNKRNIQRREKMRGFILCR